MNGQLVELANLPSRGYSYPKDIEIYVKPLKIKEQIDMDRYGISSAEYFRMVLDGITIQGNFNKENLLHSDVQFLDIVRRLFSFDTKEEIILKDCVCKNPECKCKFDYKFKVADLTFTDFNEDIFGKHFKFNEGDEEEELEIVVSPITTAEFMKMSKEFKTLKDKKTALSTMYTEYICACTREVVERNFRDLKDRNSFLKSYIGDLYLAKDKKTCRQIVDETLVKLKPFKVICEDCGEETEVEVTPSSNFQQ